MYLKVQSSFVLFYFKEERQSLRQLLVEIFGCLCGLKKEILSQLLCSVLPSELAMEIMKRKEGKKNSGHHNRASKMAEKKGSFLLWAFQLWLISQESSYCNACTFKLFDPESG